jgi:uncharacterized protein (TIGR02147 family)
MSAPDVFHYQDAMPFLQDWYEHHKQRRAESFSYAWIARQIDVRRTYVHAIFNGSRPLTVRVAARLCHLMDLDDEASEYFLQLVLLQRHLNHDTQDDPDVPADLPEAPAAPADLRRAALAREREVAERSRVRAVVAEAADRERALERVRALQWRRRAALLSAAAETYLGHWLDVVIKDLARRPDFEPTPEWIADRLTTDAPPETVRESLHRLLQLGALVRGRGGRLTPKEPELRIHLHASRQAAMRKHHLTMLERGRHAITSLPTTERITMSGTLLLEPEVAEALKSQLRQFMESAMAQGAEEPTEQAEVFQLNAQLFPFTRPPKP